MGFDIYGMIKLLPGVIIGLTVHEYMHAYAAYRLGDSTAKASGRLSLNPLKHIDPVGFLFILFAGFGWAKPVIFSKENLANPKKDTTLIAIAGPFSNLCLAISGTIFLKILVFIIPFDGDQTYRYIIDLIIYTIFINYGLFIFNILPFPPLDGSHILFNKLPISEKTEYILYKYGTLALFGVLIIESQLKINILPVGKAVKFIVQQSFELIQIF